MAALLKHSLQNKEEEQEEEEEELFEINLEAVNSIPPPPHYCETHVTATGSALFANCLLPIADVSSAIPMSKACNFLSMEGTIAEGLVAAAVVELLPSLPTKFLVQHKEMRA
ncbi:hypothetical protein SLE2022_079260 [Rubroshorea leprosula]|uniref:Uncharacterized protein n=1 Tax=Rubroshorea leprosula TaxID=152421 RepID=A0AAV5LNF8_9ROSI|nr:hypothetical protein SLEP1_g46807 [Rubroshorea leprosula]